MMVFTGIPDLQANSPSYPDREEPANAGVFGEELMALRAASGAVRWLAASPFPNRGVVEVVEVSPLTQIIIPHVTVYLIALEAITTRKWGEVTVGAEIIDGNGERAGKKRDKLGNVQIRHEQLQMGSRTVSGQWSKGKGPPIRGDLFSPACYSEFLFSYLYSEYQTRRLRETNLESYFGV
jgi:hypothetical protein